MAEILHFEILRKHGQTNTHTNKHTNKQTDMGITIPRPPPMGGEVIIVITYMMSITWGEIAVGRLHIESWNEAPYIFVFVQYIIFCGARTLNFPGI